MEDLKEVAIHNYEAICKLGELIESIGVELFNINYDRPMGEEKEVEDYSVAKYVLKTNTTIHEVIENASDLLNRIYSPKDMASK